MPPSSSVAKSVTAHSGRFSLRITTRSPLPIPHACSWRAVAVTQRWNWAAEIGVQTPSSRRQHHAVVITTHDRKENVIESANIHHSPPLATSKQSASRSAGCPKPDRRHGPADSPSRSAPTTSPSRRWPQKNSWPQSSPAGRAKFSAGLAIANRLPHQPEVLHQVLVRKLR